eukprot:2345507-Alexandrium_andersonii.AAC.1
MSHFLGSESSGELQGAPQSSAEHRAAPESLGLVHLLYLLRLKAGRNRSARPAHRNTESERAREGEQGPGPVARHTRFRIRPRCHCTGPGRQGC